MRKALVLILFLIVSAPVWASTLTISGGAWQPFPGASNTYGTYFSRPSYDGTSCNLSFYIAGSSGTCSNRQGATNASPTNLPYYGTAIWYPAPNISWMNTSGADVVLNISYVTEITANPVVTFGYYDYSGRLIQLFTTADTPGVVAAANITVPAGVKFGFYLTNPWESSVLATESSISNTEKGIQHFVVFGSEDNFYISLEDTLIRDSADFDYNDMILRVTAAPVAPPATVPEPSAFVLLAGGCLGLLGLKRGRFMI